MGTYIFWHAPKWHCEYELEKCSFFMGKIITVEDDCISFLDVGMDGMWDIDAHEICFDKITQISCGDNYFKIYYKYVERR